jgi:phosphatidylglycerol:prolipoprotein diacylglycerol transferase
MIPFFELPQLSLPLGLHIDIFGVLSAAGVITGVALATRAAGVYWPGDDRPMREFVTWAVLPGLIGGHLMHLFAYHPELLTAQDPFVILRFWEGLSSMGGVLGALVGIFAFFRKEGIPVGPYLDALALGTAPGWAIARIGCFLVHDHPGVRTDFFLAVNFPVERYGGPRHDLGLYDFLGLAVITAVLYAVSRTRPRQGRLMGILAVLYSAQRFFTDFLRASDLSFVDRRYGLFTPAQFVVVGLFGVGIWLLVRAAPEVTPLKAKKAAKAAQRG